jgi:hypothetical protein
MAKFTTTQSFANSEQITSGKLNAIVSGLSADADLAADGTIVVSAGALRVGVLSATNLQSNSVTTAKIADANVTTGKLADLAATEGKIAAGAVTAGKIADEAVTYAKTLPADRAVQADMQAESAAHFTSPDVLKFHPGVAKAYGRVAMETASAAITGGYNVTSATDTGTNSREITLGITMANTNYVVIATPSDGGSAVVTVSGKTTTKFTLTGSAEGTGRYIEFVVFGQRA